MRKMEVAMAMICQVDKYHMQRRPDEKRIGAAGLIACFGGEIEVEKGEKAPEAMSRELAEETNLVIQPADLRLIDTVDVVSDRDLKPLRVHAKVFEVLLPHGYPVEAREGQLVTWTRGEIIEHVDQLSPATKKFFGRYFQ